MPNACLERSSIEDAELFEFTVILLPGNIHMLYDCSLRAALAPFDQFSDTFIGPLTDNFHPAIPEVSHIAREMKFVCLPFGVIAVENPLD